MWTEKLYNGKYRCIERYYDPMTDSMKKASVTIDKNTKQAIKAAAQTLQAKIEKLTEDRTVKITLKELSDAYLAHQKLTVKPSTYTRNKYAIKSIRSILGDSVVLHNMTAGYVRKAFLDSGRTPGDLNEKLKRLKALIRWGYQNDLIQNDITGKMICFHDTPHKDKIRDKYMDSEELKKVLAVMDREDWNLLTRFQALSGLRIGETTVLYKNEVDLKNRVIRISSTYDLINKVRTTAKSEASIDEVFIQPELYEVCRQINRLMAKRKIAYGITTDLFFFDRHGDPLAYKTYNDYLKKKTLSAIGRELTTHALRHTHASLMFENGLDLETVSRRLRHANSKITREIYIHVTKTLRKKDNEKIRQIRIL